MAVGLLSGLGAFTFGYGDGAAYLGNDPASCANCHVMQEPYDAWVKSTHHAVATCNDCHLSHHPVGKWITKADNGFFHSVAFTTGNYPDPIRIKPRNKRVTQQAACLHCHKDFVHSLLPPRPEDEGATCVELPRPRWATPSAEPLACRDRTEAPSTNRAPPAERTDPNVSDPDTTSPDFQAQRGKSGLLLLVFVVVALVDRSSSSFVLVRDVRKQAGRADAVPARCRSGAR